MLRPTQKAPKTPPLPAALPQLDFGVEAIAPTQDPFTRLHGLDLGVLIEFLDSRASFLTREHVSRLTRLTNQLAAKEGRKNPTQGPQIGGDFSLSDEVSQQIAAMQALRDMVFDGQRIIGEVKEAKEALSAATTLLSLLVKMEGEVRTIEHLRAVEAAVIEVLKDEAPEMQTRLLALMEARLGTNGRLD